MCKNFASFFHESPGELVHYAINACLVKLVGLHGTCVTTIEGIGSVKDGLHPLQKALHESHGSQCGFCSPGMVMSASSLIRQSQNQCSVVDLEDVEKCLEGNLCRCTGYRPILEAFSKFTSGDSKEDPIEKVVFRTIPQDVCDELALCQQQASAQRMHSKRCSIVGWYKICF